MDVWRGKALPPLPPAVTNTLRAQIDWRRARWGRDKEAEATRTI